MNTTFDARVITAILPEDVDTLVLSEALYERFGVTTVFQHRGRGVGRTTRRIGKAPRIPGRRSLFSVQVSADQADAVFHWLLEAAGVARPAGGLVFQQRLGCALMDS